MFRAYGTGSDALGKSDANFLALQEELAITEDRAGALWVGTHGAGLNRFDRRRGLWRRYLHDADDPASLAHNAVRVVDRKSVV